MREVFNLGAGLLVAVPPHLVDSARAAAAAVGLEVWVAGEIRAGAGGVRFT
jgi:phosphoribosylaminoimidazole (AIR) synthetase